MASVTVQLTGGPPWGFRLHGGRGHNIPLTVAKVRRKSKSFGRLVEGDEIQTIGGRSVEGLSHDEAMALVDSHSDKLDITLKRTGNLPQIPQDSETKPSSQAISSSYQETSTFSSTPTSFQRTTVEQQNASQSSSKLASTIVGSEAGGQAGFAFSPPSGIQSTSATQQNQITQSSSSTSSSQQRVQEDTNMDIRSERKNETQSTTVNISGAKFDLGSDFSTPPPPPFTFGGASSTKVSTSNPFAGMERILESESKTSKEHLPGGELNRLETRETKIVDGAYIQSHTLQETSHTTTTKTGPLSISCANPQSLDDTLFVSPSGMPIKERYYKPLSEEQQKEIDDIMAPILNKKKVFTSSSFYVDENCTYPTVEEQVGMARKIAESLSSDSNKQSKGSNMFFRRVKRSHKWVHQAPGISESEYTESEDCSTHPDPDKFPGVKISKDPPKLKLLMAPGAPKDQWDQPTQDPTVSPDVCLDIVKGLNSPCGKGAQMFAKRKKKSEDWVVDVDKLKAQLGDKWPEKEKENETYIPLCPPQPPPKPAPVQAPRLQSIGDRYLEQAAAAQSRVRLIKSPWEAALESPIGSVEAAFSTNDAPCVVARLETRTPLSTLPVADVPAVAQGNDPLTARSPRGWGGHQNVCVAVQKKAPPPPPPRPAAVRPPRYVPQPTAVAPPCQPCKVPSVPTTPSSFDCEPMPPPQFFNALGQVIDYPSYPMPDQYEPPQSDRAGLFNPYSRQNFNSAARGFGYGNAGGKNFRSVRL